MTTAYTDVSRIFANLVIRCRNHRMGFRNSLSPIHRHPQLLLKFCLVPMVADNRELYVPPRTLLYTPSERECSKIDFLRCIPGIFGAKNFQSEFWERLCLSWNPLEFRDHLQGAWESYYASPSVRSGHLSVYEEMLQKFASSTFRACCTATVRLNKAWWEYVRLSHSGDGNIYIY